VEFGVMDQFRRGEGRRCKLWLDCTDLLKIFFFRWIIASTVLGFLAPTLHEFVTRVFHHCQVWSRLDLGWWKCFKVGRSVSLAASLTRAVEVSYLIFYSRHAIIQYIGRSFFSFFCILTVTLVLVSVSFSTIQRGPIKLCDRSFRPETTTNYHSNRPAAHSLTTFRGFTRHHKSSIRSDLNFPNPSSSSSLPHVTHVFASPRPRFSTSTKISSCCQQ